MDPKLPSGSVLELVIKGLTQKFDKDSIRYPPRSRHEGASGQVLIALPPVGPTFLQSELRRPCQDPQRLLRVELLLCRVRGAVAVVDCRVGVNFGACCHGRMASLTSLGGLLWSTQMILSF